MNGRDADRTGLQKKLEGLERFETLVGGCDAMREAFATVETVAATDACVLLVGEAGTGKRLMARAVHELSRRCEAPFVTVHSAGSPLRVLEGEIFGLENGGNGGGAPVTGRLEQADGGTLLIDGICGIPTFLQAKLSAFLRDGEIRRVDGSERVDLDVRLIATTDRLPKTGDGSGALRDDLYYRLGVVTVELPPLRERGEDIAAMARSFLDRFAGELGRAAPGLGRSAVSAMMTHRWPGNVAELEARVRRAAILSRGRLLTPGDLGLTDNGGENGRTLVEARNELERSIVADALMQAAGNVSRAARAIGVSRPTMYDLIHKYGLDVSDYKGLAGP